MRKFYFQIFFIKTCLSSIKKKRKSNIISFASSPVFVICIFILFILATLLLPIEQISCFHRRQCHYSKHSSVERFYWASRLISSTLSMKTTTTKKNVCVENDLKWTITFVLQILIILMNIAEKGIRSFPPPLQTFFSCHSLRSNYFSNISLSSEKTFLYLSKKTF